MRARNLLSLFCLSLSPLYLVLALSPRLANLILPMNFLEFNLLRN